MAKQLATTVLCHTLLAAACPLYIFLNPGHRVISNGQWLQNKLFVSSVASAIDALCVFCRDVAARPLKPDEYGIATIIVAFAATSTAIMLSRNGIRVMRPHRLAFAVLCSRLFLSSLQCAFHLYTAGLNIPSTAQLASTTIQVLLACSTDDVANIHNRDFSLSRFWISSFDCWLKETFYFGYLASPKHLDESWNAFSTSVLTEKFQVAWSNVTEKRRPNSLLYTVLKLNWESIAMGLPCRILLAVSSFAQPFVLFKAIESVPVTDVSESQSRSLFFVTILVYGSISLFQSLHDTMSNRTLVTIRSTLRGAIITKSLRLPASDASKGAAITLISTELEAMELGILRIHSHIVGFFEFVVAIYSLHFFVGYLGNLLLIPILCGAFWSIKASSRGATARSAWTRKLEERVHQTTQILAQVKEVKLLGFQQSLTEYMQGLRTEEMNFWWRDSSMFMLTRATAYICLSLTPVLFIGLGLATKVLALPLNCGQIFATLMIIQSIQDTFIVLIHMETNINSMTNSIERVKEYLLLTEQQDSRLKIGSPSTPPPDKKMANKRAHLPIRIRRATIHLSENGSQALRSISIGIAKSQLTIAIGLTGSGKSIFLKALIGEIQAQEGFITVEEGPIAYCDQKPWLFHGTIRENIVGQTTFDKTWYQTVLAYCCLAKDLAELADGDQTIVGNRGTALSGGQCQRVAIARAVYSRTKMMIWDDVFSAVDNDIGARLFNGLLGEKGLLRSMGTTVLLATHSTQYFNTANTILFFNSHGKVVKRTGAGIGTLNISTLQEPEASENDTRGEARASRPVYIPPELADALDEEHSIHNRSKLAHIWFLLGTAPAWLFGLFLSATILCSLMEHAQTVFATYWVEIFPDSPIFFIPFTIISIAPMIAFIIMAMVFYQHIGPIYASNMHKLIVDTLMGATLSYLTAANHGVLIHRITHDMTFVTKRFAEAAFRFPYSIVCQLSDLVFIAAASTWTPLSLPIIVAATLLAVRFQLGTSHRLKVLNLEAKSSLYKQMTEISTGIEHIRSFQWTQQYQSRMFEAANQEMSTAYTQRTVKIWLSFLLGGLNALIALMLIAISIYWGHTTSPGLIGLGFAGVMNFTSRFDFLLAMVQEMQTCMASIVRLHSFINNTPQERDEPNPVTVPEDWPQRGIVEFENVTAKYQLSNFSHTVLRNVSFKALHLEKVGFVGRTGSGKSSVILALMNLLEYNGSIKVDGIEISRIPRHILRSRLTVNAQDTLILPGTIRQNLMPWLLKSPLARQADRETLTKVLVRAYLAAPIMLAGGLDQPMARLILSVGERQLFSLARSVLTGLHRNSNIVLLDEATSNMDLETDDKMHAVIEEAFHQHTILMVAHRVETLDDADIVYRLQNGQITEVSTGDN